MRTRVTMLVCCGVLIGGGWSARAGEAGSRANPPETTFRMETRQAVQAASYECHLQRPEQWKAALQGAVRRGEIPDPSRKPLPSVAPRALRSAGPVCVPTPTAADIFHYEDTSGVLLTNFSDGQLFSLMTDAANALLVARGDNFDFIGFWVNFDPDHQIGTAFYLSIENDVTGIGLGLFNGRASLGLAGANIEGYVMMWDINESFWMPGTGANADFTRLVLGQEFEHRFGMFLPNLLSGESLQGTSGCGRGAHWNFKVDGQGSGMEIAEWVGTSPAVRSGGSLNFNTDTGGVFSYSDLYLMGYVSPAEMDAGNSELRYMLNSCSSPYNGPISAFSSADIVASAGVRSPSSLTSQKDFQTGWVMIYQPGDPPSSAELDKAAGILAQHSLDWNRGTLRIGTMKNTLRACIPELALLPTGADVPHGIIANEIVVPEGGAQVTLELFVSNWDPTVSGTLLGTFQGKVDSSGYTSGDAGTLSPLTTPDPSAGAFIDSSRTDYVFSGLPNVTETVDTSTLDYQWSASVAAGGAADPATRRYAGTLILDASIDASGTFTVDFIPDPGSLLKDENGTLLTPLALAPALITIAPPNIPCLSAREVQCNSVVEIDNSGINLSPNPTYSCGFNNFHDGTLWFKFTATSSEVRLSTCNSVAQDSTFALYEGTCDLARFNQIGCGEDDCGPSGWLGDQCVSGLVPGNEYLIQFSAWQSSDRGQYSLELLCPCAGLPTGGCCNPDGSCEEVVEANCLSGGGTYLGDGTSCPDCNDSNVCTTDTCDPLGGCNQDGTGVTTGCDDGNACTTGDVCQGDAAGTCSGTDTSAVDCNDENLCTVDTCDQSSGCGNDGTGTTMDCDDGNVCTLGDACAGNSSGDCVGTAHCQLHGDVFPLGPPQGNCVADIDDLLFVLQAFADPDPCTNFPGADLFPCDTPCTTVDIDDVVSELEAFAGISNCTHPCPP